MFNAWKHWDTTVTTVNVKTFCSLPQILLNADMHTHSTMSIASVSQHCVANADQPMSCQQRLLHKPSVNMKSPLRAAGKDRETAIYINGVGRERIRPFCPQMVIKQSRHGWFSSVRNVRNTLPHRGGVKHKNTLIHWAELTPINTILHYTYWSF